MDVPVASIVCRARLEWHIPRNFAVWNEHAMYQNDRHARYMYQTVLTEEQRADHCQKCGACETKCPQKISIRADLQRLDQDLKKL